MYDISYNKCDYRKQKHAIVYSLLSVEPVSRLHSIYSLYGKNMGKGTPGFYVIEIKKGKNNMSDIYPCVEKYDVYPTSAAIVYLQIHRAI